MSLVFSSLPMLVAPSSRWYSVMPVDETSSSMPTRWGLSESRLTPSPETKIQIFLSKHCSIKICHHISIWRVYWWFWQKIQNQSEIIGVMPVDERSSSMPTRCGLSESRQTPSPTTISRNLFIFRIGLQFQIMHLHLFSDIVKEVEYHKVFIFSSTRYYLNPRWRRAGPRYLHSHGYTYEFWRSIKYPWFKSQGNEGQCQNLKWMNYIKLKVLLVLKLVWMRIFYIGSTIYSI